ncbi:MAG TPA: ABC transporter permease [Planctomycetaceae bacterium]|nr:ABC transporter permease [Planctomycetaceae bacterium]|tara:strand:- start:8967 stop:11729 length:2763 start_codon:yes stop_codon:yes gene_type:complete
MKWYVLDAVFKRNFVSYFSNPTGYVFICVFVLLGSLAAFWPPEFFNSNLANLDQLNRYLPYILLVFIPAITMSVWADERRQGTDELILTLPASDIEVVVGKYLSAVGIYTVSLIFSYLCNLVVLQIWGSPDPGLFLTNYLGYWFVGLAMLAIGMVASFLTSNLTVSFILGLALNAPLVVADQASSVMGPKLASVVRSWSLAENFIDFGRGIVSLSAIGYFLGIVTVCLYISMVLIGRRHWTGRRDGARMGTHFVVRTAGLAVAALGVVLAFRVYDVRADLSAEQISSLSGDTKQLLAGLDTEQAIEVTAYVSPTVPEDYTQTRLTLLNMLRQFQRLSGGKLRVDVIETETKTEAASLASQQFGIEPVTVLSRERGAFRDEDIFLGCAFTCGLEKVVVPFFDRGTPVEYELIRSICTVAEQKRKRLGVVTTDADLFGGFDMASGQQRPRQPVLEELEKQYEVVQVDPAAPITETYDVLMVVQPSSLGPEQMNNFVAAVRSGQPVAIFEDPLPVLMNSVPGTSQPRRGGGGPMAMMQQQNQPKGDLGQLWDVLGLELAAGSGRPLMGQMGSSPYVVWQDYNPHPKLELPSEFVFIDAELGEADGGASRSFNQENPITRGLQEVLFPFPGALSKDDKVNLEWTPLVITGTRSGTIEVEQVLGNRGDMRQLRIFEKPGSQAMVLAAAVDRELPGTQSVTESEKESSDGDTTLIRAIVVADIDLMGPQIFGLRNRPDEVFGLNFDNVTFVLNVLDTLSGDERFLEIRKRKPKHRTLERIEDTVADAREMADMQRQKYITEFDKAEQGANAEMQKEVGEFEKKIEDMESGGNTDRQAAMQAVQQLASRQRLAQRRLDTKLEQLKRKRDAEIEQVERSLEATIRREQDWQKWLAVMLPPIPPLVVAFFVFFRRRAQEREGVAKSRLR